jgi:predicted nucleotidyltransferase component of viral defense system
MIAALRAQARENQIPWQNLLKEALQVAFLEVFFSHSISEPAVFQGGTAIRLLYGGPRHSEDLDFVAPGDLGDWDDLVEALQGSLQRLAGAYEGELALAPTKQSSSRIRRWKLRWEPPNPRDAVWVRVEIARYPVYTRELLPLKRPAGVPVGPWVLVPTESREELLADKLTAIAGRAYVKGRDFLDLWFLRTQNVPLQPELLKKKFHDYAVNPRQLASRFKKVTAAEIAAELNDFLPLAFRRPLERDGYRVVYEVAREVLAEAVRIFA